MYTPRNPLCGEKIRLLRGAGETIKALKNDSTSRKESYGSKNGNIKKLWGFKKRRLQ